MHYCWQRWGENRFWSFFTEAMKEYAPEVLVLILQILLPKISQIIKLGTRKRKENILPLRAEDQLHI